MIFVTVGTHEQPFNRLVKAIDKLKKDGVITEDVIMQTGYSTYEPKYCKGSIFNILHKRNIYIIDYSNGMGVCTDSTG